MRPAAEEFNRLVFDKGRIGAVAGRSAPVPVRSLGAPLPGGPRCECVGKRKNQGAARAAPAAPFFFGEGALGQTLEKQLQLGGVQLPALFAKEPPRQGVKLLAQDRALTAGLLQRLTAY